MSPKFVPTAKRKVRVVGIVVYTIRMNTYFWPQNSNICKTIHTPVL